MIQRAMAAAKSWCRGDCALDEIKCRRDGVFEAGSPGEAGRHRR